MVKSALLGFGFLGLTDTVYGHFDENDIKELIADSYASVHAGQKY